MQNEERLKRVIEKAVKGGYKPTYYLGDYAFWVKNNSYYVDIFSHSFAKAFWGEEEHQVEIVRGWNENVPIWQEHLQQMVLEPEPLKYFENFLKVKV